MKRALKKREKAVLKNTPSDDAPSEQLNVNNPRVNLRMPTKAAMIGLAISMGATSILVTRQSDGVLAVEPVGNQNTASTLPATSNTEVLIRSEHAVAPENPVILEPTAITQVSGLAAKLQASASGEPKELSSPVVVKSQPQQENEQNVIGDQSQKSATASRTLSGVGINNEVNSQLKAQQEFALNRLQQKSDRLRQALTKFRSQEHNDSSVATYLAESIPVVENTPVINTSQTATDANRAKLVSRLKQRSIAKDLAPVPSVTQASVIPSSNQVKPVDTQSPTASNYGTSVSDLVKANSQSNPIPTAQNIIPVTSPSGAVTANSTVNVTSASSAPLNSGANNSSVSVVTPINANTKYQAVSEPTAANLVATTPVPSQTSPIATNSYGMGGDSPIPQAIAPIQLSAKPSDAVATKPKSNQRLRSLQDEIERLRDKYRAQQSGNPGNTVVPTVSQNNNQTPDAPGQSYVANPSTQQAIPIVVPRPTGSEYSYQPTRRPGIGHQPTQEPINPEYLPNSELPRTGIATPPKGMDASQSLGPLRGTVVSPNLPPLAAVDRYLPKPIDETTSLAAGLIWPTKGVVTSGFGWRWGRMHKGIDIANSTGTPVVAAEDGVIEKAGWNNGGYGNMVDIRHVNGTMTRYGHNSKILVQAGQQVHKGDTIALMGNTGFSTGPHCHFEVHPAGQEAVNPVAFLPPLPPRV